MASKQYLVRYWRRHLYCPCFILGNAPSILDHDLSLLKDYFTVGVNRIFKLYDPTILLWQDESFLKSEKIDHLKAIKFCRDTVDPENKYYHYHRVMKPFKFANTTHILYGTGNTGILAVQFAVALGCKPIILLGMDCNVTDVTDFYGDNKYWNDHTLKYCVNALEFIKEHCPVEIISCDDTKFWEQQKLEDVIAKLNVCPAGRQMYNRMLGI